MFVTTILISIQIRYVKHQPLLLALAFFLAFGFFDGKYRTLQDFYICVTNGFIGLFWGAALKKVPEGAWVPLMIGLVLSVTISQRIPTTKLMENLPIA